MTRRLIATLSALAGLTQASFAIAAAPTCPLDPALSNAAAELLLADRPPDGQQLMAAVRAAGSEAVGLHALFLPSDDPPRVQTWLADLRAKSDASLICGDARTATARLLIASARGATMRVEGGVLQATLAPGFARPELVVRARDGTVRRLSVQVDELARGIPFDPEWRASQVQLMAWSASGPRPVAERSLGDPPALATLRAGARGLLDVAPEAPLDAHAVADVLMQLRERHAGQRLRRNRLAERIALAHARAVCAEGRVVHALEPGIDPEARVARAGLRARLVGETVARASDPSAALEALWHSPSHALTLLEPRFTDVGVGLASDSEKRSCLVILLLAWPRAAPPPAAASAPAGARGSVQ